MIRFDGRVAIVSGAGRGLGRAYALDLAARGAQVVVNDVAGAPAVVDEIRAAGGAALAVEESVMTADGAERIAERAFAAFGRIDALVNNAGFYRDRTFSNLPLADIEAVIGVHLFGAIYLTRAVWPAMRGQEYGRVIFVTSTSGLYGNFGQTNYAAAKLGVIGFLNALKEESPKAGILVNGIAPLAQTEGAAEIFDAQSRRSMRLDWIVALVTYLASETCTTNGRLIHCGAGRYARARMAESAGVVFPPDAPVDAETIAARYAEFDGPPAKTYDNSTQAVIDKGIEPARK